MLFVVKELFVETECYWQIQLRWIIMNIKKEDEYSWKYQIYFECYVYKLLQIKL